MPLFRCITRCGSRPQLLAHCLLLVSCSHDWAAYEPGGATSAVSSSSSSSGATAGTGGAGGEVTSGSGGEAGNGGMPPAKCGDIGVLTDDFSAAALNITWNNTGGVVATPVGGELVSKLPATAPATALVMSKHRYDFRGGRAWVEIPVMVDTASTGIVSLSMFDDDDNFLRVGQEEGSLLFSMEVAAANTELSTEPYDPVAHRFWQLREQDGVVYWETSDDGVTFDKKAEAPVSADLRLDAVRFRLNTYTSRMGFTPPGEAHFDNVNGGKAPTSQWCPASTLIDDFDDGARATAWADAFSNGGATATEPDGALLIQPASDVASSAAYRTGSAYVLTGGAVVVEVSSMLDPATAAYGYLEVRDDAGNTATIRLQNGTLRLGYRKDATDVVVATPPFSPDEHRWWRIREADGAVHWETSADATTWLEQAQLAPPPLDTETVVITLGGGAPAIPSPGAIQFDDFGGPARP